MSDITRSTQNNPTVSISDSGADFKDALKNEVSLLENRYLRWVISIGLAFIILKLVDTSVEMAYLRGKQEKLDMTIEKLFQERNELIDGLKKTNEELKTRILQLESQKPVSNPSSLSKN